MFRFKKSLIAFIGLIALVSLIGLITPLSGQGPNGGNQHPLNVSVVNTASAPALVRDIGVALRTPVQIKVNTIIQFGQHDGIQDVYTVPGGQRLVVEHVTLTSETLNAGNAVKGNLTTRFGGELFSHHLDVRPQAPVLGSLFIVNHSLLAFADPGTVVTVTAVVDEVQGQGQGFYSAFFGTISGYLESVP